MLNKEAIANNFFVICFPTLAVNLSFPSLQDAPLPREWTD